MKKNLISILILALLVVNVVLTAIMMFSVMGTTKKTSQLVTNISTALNLELTKGETETDDTSVNMGDLSPFEIKDLTIPLKIGEDGKPHYCMLEITVQLNTKHEDYETMSPIFQSNGGVNNSVINGVVGRYTMEEAMSGQAVIEEAILTALREEYESDFIYKVRISSILMQ